VPFKTDQPCTVAEECDSGLLKRLQPVYKCSPLAYTAKRYPQRMTYCCTFGERLIQTPLLKRRLYDAGAHFTHRIWEIMYEKRNNALACLSAACGFVTI
jgi:hypothetical protein